MAGILVRRGCFLVEKRDPDDDADPGFVAIPGGHVEKGESLENALKREMSEELGIQVLKTTKVTTGHHTATDGEKQEIHYFHVSEWKGRIKPNEAERVYWESNVRSLTALADRKAVEKLLRRGF